MKDKYTEKILGFDIIREKLKNYASSEKGRRGIDSLELTSELPVILSDLDLVTETKRLISAGELPIHGIEDIENTLLQLKIPGQLVDPVQLYRTASTMQVSSRIFKYLYRNRDKYPSVYEVIDELEIFEDIEKEILKAVDEDGNVLDTASSELKSIRNSIQTARNRLRKKTGQVFESYSGAGYTRDTQITMREGRFVIPVKADKRSRVKGVVIDESASGNTLFVEPYEAIEINSEMEKLLRKESREIERILRSLSTLVFEIKEELLVNIDILAEIDIIYSKARFSVKYFCEHPKVNKKNIVNIYHGRHPLLIDSLGEKGVVALDLEIGEKFRSLIITGPNAGGKTVTLKTVGLLCMMVKAGMHVPAQSNSNIAVFSIIYTDIGDGQSIENDLSTFSSHISKISKILRSRNKDTLVLFDEIGASTDPAEGSSLSMAVLTELTKRKFITIATTHQGILKSFAYRTKGVENGSMEFDKKKITPTYKFRAGIPGSSYAFEISKRHGLPKYIIENAKKFVGSEKEDLEGLISELDEKITDYNNLLRKSKSVNRELSDLKEMYNRKFEEISKNEKKMLREAAKTAKGIIENSNKAIENAVAEIRSTKADKNAVKEIRKKLSQDKKKVEVLAKEPKEKKKVYDGELKPGMEVEIVNFSSSGIVESVSPKNVQVTVGSLSMKVKRSDITGVIEKDEDVSVNVKFTPSETDGTSMRLDLRGKRGDEAVAMVEKHIEKMVMNNISFSEIVHGKGQGILSRLVNEYLDSCPYIRNKKFGEYGEGDYGVTVIELK